MIIAKDNNWILVRHWLPSQDRAHLIIWHVHEPLDDPWTWPVKEDRCVGCARIPPIGMTAQVRTCELINPLDFDMEMGDFIVRYSPPDNLFRIFDVKEDKLLEEAHEVPPTRIGFWRTLSQIPRMAKFKVSGTGTYFSKPT